MKDEGGMYRELCDDQIKRSKEKGRGEEKVPIQIQVLEKKQKRQVTET